MVTDHGRGPLGGRRWPRERVWLTALARGRGGERLGRAVDMGPGGLCVVFRGAGFRRRQAVELDLVAGFAVRRLYGTVCFASPRGRYTRVGIRTFGFLPGPDECRATRRGAADGASPRVPRRRAVPPAGPVTTNLGLDFPLVSAGARRAMERDRRELSRAVRERYGGSPTEDWNGVLRRFLDDLADSPLRHRFLREQFRAAMHTRYPAGRGSVIHGRVVADGPGLAAGDLPPWVIHLDHFAVASSDRWGRFEVRGIPSVDDPVSLPLRIANHAVLSTRPVAITLPGAVPARFAVDLPVHLRAAPVRPPAARLTVIHGGQRSHGEDCPIDFDLLRRRVEQL